MVEVQEHHCRVAALLVSSVRLVVVRGHHFRDEDERFRFRYRDQLAWSVVVPVLHFQDEVGQSQVAAPVRHSPEEDELFRFRFQYRGRSA